MVSLKKEKANYKFRFCLEIITAWCTTQCIRCVVGNVHITRARAVAAEEKKYE